jgi:hypothetical protein
MHRRGIEQAGNDDQRNLDGWFEAAELSKSHGIFPIDASSDPNRNPGGTPVRMI